MIDHSTIETTFASLRTIYANSKHSSNTVYRVSICGKSMFIGNDRDGSFLVTYEGMNNVLYTFAGLVQYVRERLTEEWDRQLETRTRSLLMDIGEQVDGCVGCDRWAARNKELERRLDVVRQAVDRKVDLDSLLEGGMVE